MDYVTLNNGVKMPQLGFGTFQIKDPAECERAVRDAIDVGYRLIDTAASYGNEEAVGKAVRACGVPREELFVTTKLWVSDTSYEGAKRGFAASMERLGLDYLDLYLIHQPLNDYYGAWRAMTELYREGKIRAIGVCSFYPDRLADLVAFNEIAPAVNQVECNPMFQQKELRAFMAQYGIVTEAWYPLGHGDQTLLTHPTLTALADRYHKNVGQIILRWHIQDGIVALPKATSSAHIAGNIDIFDFRLTDEEMDQIRSMDTGKGTHDPENPETAKRLLSFRIHD